MSLTEELISYINKKFDRHYKMQNQLIERQNEILSEMLEFWKHGPAFLEETFQDADDDKIDDAYGEYDVEGQNKKQIHRDWVESGYLNDPLYPKRD